jgi:hypothetical protein
MQSTRFVSKIDFAQKIKPTVLTLLAQRIDSNRYQLIL